MTNLEGTNPNKRPRADSNNANDKAPNGEREGTTPDNSPHLTHGDTPSTDLCNGRVPEGDNPTHPPVNQSSSQEEDDLYDDEPIIDEEANATAAEQASIVAEMQAKENRKRPTKHQPPPTVPTHTTREYTPIPANGFPSIHGADPLWTVNNVTPAQAIDWLNLDGAKVLVMIEKEVSHEPDRGAQLADALAKDIDANFNISGTRAIYGFSTVPTRIRRGDPPYTFCVYNLPSRVAQALLTTGSWRNKYLRYNCFPTGRIPQTYLGALSGFCHTSSETDRMLIKSHIQTQWRNGPVGEVLDSILQPIRRDNNGDLIFGEGGLVEKAINSLTLSRLDVKETGAVDKPALRLYIETGITGVEDWLRVKAAVESTKYEMSFLGCGIYKAAWYCDTCRGIDHPTGMCPYLSIPHDIPLTEFAVPRAAKTKKNKSEGYKGDTNANDGGKKKGPNPKGPWKPKAPRSGQTPSR